MHGVKRVRESREAQDARKERERDRLTAYLSVSDELLARKKINDWSKEAFDLTTRMLSSSPERISNPEFYTIWNYRRNILLNGIFPSSSPQEINDLVSNDLSMTTVALKAHPKVYWIWNHRRWCLENVPEGGDNGDPQGWRKANWEREMFIVEKMLDADSRNCKFHAWDYRRYVLAGMPVPRSEKAELSYTTKKIESNFSNFSAWHQRTKVLSSLWTSGKLDKETSIQQEFDLVQNAMFTDPNDQSVWLYHRWLIGSGQPYLRCGNRGPCSNISCPLGDDRALLEREIELIQVLLDEQPDSKWCMECLVHYKQLLLRNHSPSFDRDGLETIRQDCLQLLKQLEDIDPARKQRYRDIATDLKT
ncbi:rab-protein geranylgeranyltransferase [Amylostereum chailletii]|nr:rab-protein geranylgeranyltransferase [Amylostereum chailletii]